MIVSSDHAKTGTLETGKFERDGLGVIRAKAQTMERLASLIASRAALAVAA